MLQCRRATVIYDDVAPALNLHFRETTMKLRKVGAVFFFALLMAWSVQGLALSADQITIERPVVDHAGVLSPSTVSSVEQKLWDHMESTGVQIAVLVVDTTHGVPIEDYSLTVAERWGGGAAGRDDGVLFTMAIEDRRNRIEVGYGLESVLPDSEAARILDSAVGHLRSSDYDSATREVVDQIIARTQPGAGVATAPYERRLAVVPLFLLMVLMVVVGVAMGAYSEHWLSNSKDSTIPIVGILVGAVAVPWLGGLALLIVVPLAGLVVYAIFWLFCLGLGFLARAKLGEGVMLATFILTSMSPVGIIAIAASAEGVMPLEVIGTPVVIGAVGIVYCSMLLDGGGTGSGSSTFSSSGGGSSSSSFGGGGGSFGGGGASGSW